MRQFKIGNIRRGTKEVKKNSENVISVWGFN